MNRRALKKRLFEKKSLESRSLERRSCKKKLCVMVFFILALVSVMVCGIDAEAEGIAAELPSADSVLQSYHDNPYLRFYEGNEGSAWTTIHPGGYAVTGKGTYIYAGAQSIYRGEEGMTVVPSGVVTRRQITGELLKGDVITVSTRIGHKTVVLTRNGVDSNIINRLVTGSTWLELSEGRNTFHITAGKNIKISG